jgi:hypothetical protein
MVGKGDAAVKSALNLGVVAGALEESGLLSSSLVGLEVIDLPIVDDSGAGVLCAYRVPDAIIGRADAGAKSDNKIRSESNDRERDSKRGLEDGKARAGDRVFGSSKGR